MLVAGVVVDVDGDGAELGDFGLERREGVVVLAGRRGVSGGLLDVGGWERGGTVRVRRLLTLLRSSGGVVQIGGGGCRR